MTYPQLNKAAHCLQAFANFWRSPQPEPSIPTAHFWSASFFCFSHSPSAFPPSKAPWFLWEQNTSWEWTELGDVPKCRPKAGLKSVLCRFCQEQTQSRAEISTLQSLPGAGQVTGAGPTRVYTCEHRLALHAHAVPCHTRHTHALPPAPWDGRRLSRTPSIPFCFNIAENCFDSWIASLFITRS